MLESTGMVCVFVCGVVVRLWWCGGVWVVLCMCGVVVCSVCSGVGKWGVV